MLLRVEERSTTRDNASLHSIYSAPFLCPLGSLAHETVLPHPVNLCPAICFCLSSLHRSVPTLCRQPSTPPSFCRRIQTDSLAPICHLFSWLCSTHVAVFSIRLLSGISNVNGQVSYLPSIPLSMCRCLSASLFSPFLHSVTNQTTLFNDPEAEIQQLTFIVKRDLNTLSEEIDVLNKFAHEREHKQSRQASDHWSTVIGNLRNDLAGLMKKFAEVLQSRTKVRVSDSVC